MSQIHADTQLLQLTKESFKHEVVESPIPVLIDFWAPWCGPCRAMKPILDEAAVMLKGHVRIAQVNVDEQKELAAAFWIRSIPTCLLMQGDKVLKSFVGVIPARQLAIDALATLEIGGAR